MRNILAAATLFITCGAIAGPLGLNKGMTLDEVQKQGNFTSAGQPYIYSAKTLVRGHPDFELYTVVVSPDHGLCKIQAAGKDIQTSVYGTELADKFKDLVATLTEKYGAPAHSFDFLRSGSIWDESKDWMMGLLKKERTLATYWSPPKNTDLPDSLRTISIEVYALSANKGYLKLGYEFDNVSECLDKLKSKKNSNL